MPTIRVERIAVRPFFLGLFGFDHLQLVHEHAGAVLGQDDWFVIEGVRDRTPYGAVLGVQGSDGRLTLARANAASRSDLVGKIGTPEQRGSIVIASGPATDWLWSAMAQDATEIDDLHLPYAALPASEGPACNSSSVVATLLHRCGFLGSACLPTSVRLIPGFETVISRDFHWKCWPQARGRGKDPQSDRRLSGRVAWCASGF